jgi:DNA polymerase
MNLFSVDAETSSYIDLPKLGADVYTRDPRTRCLMLAYHPIGHPSEVQIWLEGDPVPYAVIGHIANGGGFAGWNVVGFDRQVYNRILVPRHGFPPVPDDAWKDSMHLSASANLPRSLDGCAKAVGVAHNADLKDSNHIRLITDANRTVIPAPVAEILGDPGRFDKKLVEHLHWLRFRCLQDVAMEEQVLVNLPPWPDMKPWVSMPMIDRKINDRGVMVDLPLVQGLAHAATIETTRLDREMHAVTRGEVPRTTNVDRLKMWLMSRGVELPRVEEEEDEGDEGDDEDEPSVKAGSTKSPWRLRKGDIADLMARTDVPEECRLALSYRAEAAKASTGKLKAMMGMADDQWRLKGSLLLGGAPQTLRWSSIKIQLHNTLRDAFANLDDIADTNGLNAKKDGEQIRRLADVALRTAITAGRTGDPELMRSMYETIRKDSQGRSYRSGVINWVARMVRRCICAPGGHLLLNGDWAQVEARITVWLSQQTDILSAFASGEDVYRIAAAGIYKCAMDQITKLMRQTGKVSILALGFGGGPHALAAMAVNYGILMSLEEAQPIVTAWRESNAATKAYWYAVDDAAAMAVMYPGREFHVPPLGLVSYFTLGDCLCCRLPSGRLLRYWQPRLRQEHWADGKPKNRLSLSALTVKGRAVFRRSVYHTILVENQVQAIAADLLATALLNADEAGLPVSLHVHDNLAAEVPEDDAERLLIPFKQVMLDMPAWTRGLPIGVEAEAGARFG